MRFRRTLRLLVVPALALALACDDKGTDPDPPVVPTQPEDAITRLIWAYENQRATEYEALFTGDFVFEFSNSADPTLANQWSTGWFKSDEVLAARHLFQGGVNLDGKYLPPASSIDLIFTKTVPVADTEGRDSTRYRVLSTPVDAVVVALPDSTGAEPTRYIVMNNSHRFYLVRGDAANGLTPSQPADSVHWYIWAWRDETVGFRVPAGRGADAAAVPTPTVPTTWGKVKGVYR